jgi:hypothetical protein
MHYRAFQEFLPADNFHLLKEEYSPKRDHFHLLKEEYSPNSRKLKM